MIIRKTAESVTKRTNLPFWLLVLFYDSPITHFIRADINSSAH